MGTKVYPIKVINKTFPITVADAVKIQGSNKNIINYVDETVNSLREYCNNDLTTNIKNYLRDIEKIDVVKDLGVIPEKQDEITRANNATLIKSKICESKRNFEGGIVLFFPSGTYHIDPIEFNEEFTDSPLTVFLVGENKGFNNYCILGNKGVQIYTYGNFMVRTNTTGTNVVTFNARDLRFQQHDVNLLSQNAPHGILFGATTNLGKEYNFHIYNCDIVGYEKGLYSPGYSCGGTRIINSYFGLCKYGILIMNTCHTLSMDNVAFNICYRGLTLLLGGDYCEIKHIHFDTSFHISYQTFLEEDSRCYGIYTVGGMVIDGIYTEQYNSSDNFIPTPTTYAVIDYEGNSYSCGGKLVLRNVPIAPPAAGSKIFFRGANFYSRGTLKIDGVPITDNPLRITHETGTWQKGSVDFVRCDYTIQSLKESIDIYGGNDRAAGYVFDYRDVYGDGVAFTMHPRRGYKGSLIYNPSYVSEHPKYAPIDTIYNYSEKGAMFYNSHHYDPNVLTYKGNRLPNVGSSLLQESTGNNTCHVTGNIHVNNIDNPNVDVDVFIYFLPVIANTPFSTAKRIKLFSLNSSNINTEFIIPIDFNINALEYYGFMFGYEVKKDGTFSSLSDSEQTNYVLRKMLQVKDEKKIIYDYEYVWDEYGIVRRLDVQQIELSSSTLTLDDTTTTQQLTVTYYPAQTTQKGVNWVSSNKEIATVDTDGNVTKVGVGECEITATCNNTDYAHSATCKVTVS